MATILIFGDSIAYGEYDTKGGWAQRLRNFLHKKASGDSDYFSVYNLGVNRGDTTNDLLKRFSAETKARIEKKPVFIFSIGINDSTLLYNKKVSKNLPWVDLVHFKTNLKNLIKKARHFSDKIIFIGLTPIDESKTTPVPWRLELSYKKERVKKYDAAIKKICKEKKVEYIGLFNKLEITDLKDGLHPNSQGHQKLFEFIKDFLIKKKIIQ